MNIKLCKTKENKERKGKYIDKNIAKQFIEISRGIRAFREKQYDKAIQYLEKKALYPNATERIKYIVGTSYVETNKKEKEASELLKSIIQKYKDEPKEKRPVIYKRSIFEYAKIQIRNELTEFAIYLLEEIVMQNDEYDVKVLVELSKAYDKQAQELRLKEKYEQAKEYEQKAVESCLKCKKILTEEKDCKDILLSIKNLLAVLYMRTGKVEMAEQEFKEIYNISSENKEELCENNSLFLLKKTYFKEESEEEFNKRVKELDNTKNCRTEKEREIDLISRAQYYEELEQDLKISTGIDIFTGYKMYEYPEKAICVIDKIFNETKQGRTYIFPQNIKFEKRELTREQVKKMLDTHNSIQRQEHEKGYYNAIQEKMKRAELEGLVLEEKQLKKIKDKKEKGEN